MKRFLIFSIIALSLSACQEEKPVGTPTVEGLYNDRVVLSDGSEIQLPVGTPANESTLFILRHGEAETEDKDLLEARLTSNGLQQQAQAVALFDKVNINSVLAPMTGFANQFAQGIAESKNTKVYTYNAKDYGALLDWVYKHEKGSRIVIVGYAHSIPDLLNILTAGETFGTIPDGVYNDLFIVTTASRGNAKVWRVKY